MKDWAYFTMRIMKNIFTCGNSRFPSKVRLGIVFFCLIIAINGNLYSQCKNCGIYCLEYILKCKQIDFSQKDIDKCFTESHKELSFFDLSQAAKTFHLSPKAKRLSWEDLLNSPLPGIAWVKGDHFVVVEKGINRKITVIDTFYPPVLFDKDQFSKIWKGEILFLSTPDKGWGETKNRLLNKPLIALEKVFLDLEDVDPDIPTTCSFRIYNVGDGDLIVEEILHSCDCLQGSIDKNTLKPGDKARISIR